MQNFAQNLPTCAELTKQHRNCKVLQVLLSNIAFSSAMTAATAITNHFQCKSNKIKQHQELKKNIEMYITQNYKLSKTKQLY